MDDELIAGKIIGRDAAGSVEGGITSSITNSYDANGTLVSATDRDGTVTEYAYDADNRVISQKVSKGNMN